MNSYLDELREHFPSPFYIIIIEFYNNTVSIILNGEFKEKAIDRNFRDWFKEKILPEMSRVELRYGTRNCMDLIGINGEEFKQYILNIKRPGFIFTPNHSEARYECFDREHALETLNYILNFRNPDTVKKFKDLYK
jgi:hypothetical protein